LVLLITFSTVAGALGFMQLSRYVQETMIDSAYAALVLYGGLQVLESVWAYLLRTRVAREMYMVTRHRALLQRRGEALLGWIAGITWIVVVLRNARVLDPITAALREMLAAQATVGSLTISAGAVLAFLITVWLSFAFSRFLRFILAEDVYSRVSLTPGMPYALSTLLHYAVLLIGFVMALAATGMQLDRFALLAGAFGVGIGFGLQTIVNNFVSGLILLFERPVKVGDTIQVGTIAGEVRHIGIRSSTLRTFDGADVIVPNGELVSVAVTNWTFSDRTRRIDIPLGVTYGADPEKVIGLLRGVAVNHPLVIEHPAPVAFFTGFGDNALTFELRCWTDTFDKWPQTRSDLAVKINAVLKEAGIEIPFPQRDLRLIGSTLSVRLLGGDEPKE
jgi:small-conductance mechanosensitive channel